MITTTGKRTININTFDTIRVLLPSLSLLLSRRARSTCALHTLQCCCDYGGRLHSLLTCRHYYYYVYHHHLDSILNVFHVFTCCCWCCAHRSGGVYFLLVALLRIIVISIEALSCMPHKLYTMWYVSATVDVGAQSPRVEMNYLCYIDGWMDV